MNYQYGVEFATNGEKPDLPGDVIVEFKNKSYGPYNWVRIDEVNSINWSGVYGAKDTPNPVTSFRVVDQRYKPSQLSKAGKLDIERIDVIGQNGNDGLHYGVKHDSDKPRYDLIPPHSLDEFAKVLTFGAKKYKPNGWRNVERERYVAALGRHWQALLAGETHDQESGLHHGAHIMCDAAFIAEMDIEAGMEL